MYQHIRIIVANRDLSHWPSEWRAGSARDRIRRELNSSFIEEAFRRRWLGPLLVVLACVSSSNAAESWPRFRGVDGSGLAAPESKLPTEIGPDTHVVWKIALPPGHSSPLASSVGRSSSIGSMRSFDSMRCRHLPPSAVEAVGGAQRECWRSVSGIVEAD